MFHQSIISHSVQDLGLRRWEWTCGGSAQNYTVNGLIAVRTMVTRNIIGNTEILQHSQCPPAYKGTGIVPPLAWPWEGLGENAVVRWSQNPALCRQLNPPCLEEEKLPKEEHPHRDASLSRDVLSSARTLTWDWMRPAAWQLSNVPPREKREETEWM